MRVFVDRTGTQQVSGGGGILDKVLGMCSQLSNEGKAVAMTDGVHVSVHALWRVSSSFGKTWSGDLSGAALDLEAASAWISKFGDASWLNAYHAMAVVELDWARGDWSAAEQHIARAVHLADAAEHEEFVCLAHLQASQIYEAQGKFSDGLGQMRKLALRERRIRGEAMDSRALMSRKEVA